MLQVQDWDYVPSFCGHGAPSNRPMVALPEPQARFPWQPVEMQTEDCEATKIGTGIGTGQAGTGKYCEE